MLNHDENKSSSKKPLLTRGPKIEVTGTVDRKDIEPKKNTTTSENKVVTSVTEPANLRADNHLRNKVASLITLGYGNSQKEVIAHLLSLIEDGMDKDELKRYQDLMEIYEEKDLKNYLNKKKK
ncbi:DUF5388 domain-containing protein [Listeria booriae]|nr:DUF5388 domain-containing protein [Listeria booriae]